MVFRQRLSRSIGKDGTSLPSSPSLQCGPAPCGTPSVLLPPLQRRSQHLDRFGFEVKFQVFGWTDSTLTLFTLWGTLDFPLFFFPSALLLRKSLRLSVVTEPDLFSNPGFWHPLYGGRGVHPMSTSSISSLPVLLHSLLPCW